MEGVSVIYSKLSRIPSAHKIYVAIIAAAIIIACGTNSLTSQQVSSVNNKPPATSQTSQMPEVSSEVKKPSISGSVSGTVSAADNTAPVKKPQQTTAVLASSNMTTISAPKTYTNVDIQPISQQCQQMIPTLYEAYSSNIKTEYTRHINRIAEIKAMDYLSDYEQEVMLHTEDTVYQQNTTTIYDTYRSQLRQANC
jgi:hypothetical protein